ncbi:hypothetical protein NIASO_01395 [Niabella soli DSM 19437]|uniref:Uncharacterized protein n=1 Tax=Niabella soli DSM 19437 TaxID=929713 RepID=W0F254_9BACT|nr:hypothetical protein NIASO_01395 [Niabella soli DSM 19437]
MEVEAEDSSMPDFLLLAFGLTPQTSFIHLRKSAQSAGNKARRLGFYRLIIE